MQKPIHFTTSAKNARATGAQKNGSAVRTVAYWTTFAMLNGVLAGCADNARQKYEDAQSDSIRASNAAARTDSAAKYFAKGATTLGEALALNGKTAGDNRYSEAFDYMNRATDFDGDIAVRIDSVFEQYWFDVGRLCLKAGRYADALHALYTPLPPGRYNPALKASADSLMGPHKTAIVRAALDTLVKAAGTNEPGDAEIIAARIIEFDSTQYERVKTRLVEGYFKAFVKNLDRPVVENEWGPSEYLEALIRIDSASPRVAQAKERLVKGLFKKLRQSTQGRYDDGALGPSYIVDEIVRWAPGKKGEAAAILSKYMEKQQKLDAKEE